MTTTATTAAPTVITKPTRLRRGLPVMWATLRENKIALFSLGGYLVLVILLVAGIGNDFDLTSFQAVGNSAIGKALWGLGGTQLQNGFVPFLAIQLYGSFYGLIFGGALAFFVGSTIARSIENGMIELALTRPISRTRYYLERWAGGVLMVGLMSAVILLMLVFVDVVFPNTEIDWAWLVATQAVGATLWLACIGIGMLMSVVYSSGRAGGGAALGVIVLLYLFNVFGSANKSLEFLDWLSPFRYAKLGNILLLHQLTWWHPLALTLVGLITGIVGLIHFNRRDLAA